MLLSLLPFFQRGHENEWKLKVPRNPFNSAACWLLVYFWSMNLICLVCVFLCKHPSVVWYSACLLYFNGHPCSLHKDGNEIKVWNEGFASKPLSYSQKILSWVFLLKKFNKCNSSDEAYFILVASVETQTISIHCCCLVYTSRLHQNQSKDQVPKSESDLKINYKFWLLVWFCKTKY